MINNCYHCVEGHPAIFGGVCSKAGEIGGAFCDSEHDCFQLPGEKFYHHLSNEYNIRRNLGNISMSKRQFLNISDEDIVERPWLEEYI